MDPQFTVAYSTVAEDKTFGQSLRTFCQLCLTCELSNVGVSQKTVQKSPHAINVQNVRVQKSVRIYLPL